MKKETRSKLFNILITGSIGAGSGYLLVIYEDVSLGWLVALVLLWMALIFALDYYKNKKFKTTLEQPLEGIIVELKGGKYTRKKEFWISLFTCLTLVLIGVLRSNAHLNFRVLLVSLGTFFLLVGISQFLSSKKRPQISVFLLKDRLILLMPNKEETILIKDLRDYIYEEKKIHVLSHHHQKITIDSREFEEEEFMVFKSHLQSVTEYWLKKKEQELA